MSVGVDYSTASVFSKSSGSLCEISDKIESLLSRLVNFRLLLSDRRKGVSFLSQDSICTLPVKKPKAKSNENENQDRIFLHDEEENKQKLRRIHSKYKKVNIDYTDLIVLLKFFNIIRGLIVFPSNEMQYNKNWIPTTNIIIIIL